MKVDSLPPQYHFLIFHEDTSTPLSHSSESTFFELKHLISQSLQLPFASFSIYLQHYGQIDLPDLMELPLSILELPSTQYAALFLYDSTNKHTFSSLYCSFRILGFKPCYQIGYKVHNSTVICFNCAKHCRNKEIDSHSPITNQSFICKCAQLNDNKCKFCSINRDNEDECKQLQMITTKVLLDNHSEMLLKCNERKRQNELSAIRNRSFDFERSISYGLQRVNQYDNATTKAKVLELIPPKEKEMNMHDYIKFLLKWFKNDFFTWCNKPQCPSCKHTSHSHIRTDPPNASESPYLCSRTEVYECPHCKREVRFPRYNDPYKLLETRTGRCGEYANVFGCILNAIGVKVRFVDNFEDHVWNEFYSDIEHRWIHVDSCEGVFDKPLLYEQGWGRVMTFILAHSKEGCYDVTPRYIKTWEECQERRSASKESELHEIIEGTNLSLKVNFSEDMCRDIEHREQSEEMELALRKEMDVTISKEEQMCRQSGSVEWKLERGEMK